MTRWQVFCAVALRRLPELLPRPCPIESRVQEIFNAYELAKSKYSNHELDHLADLKDKENEETSIIVRETAQDREERWAKQRSQFDFGPYIDRLTYIHYVFVKQKFGSDPNLKWLLPQTEYDIQQDRDLMDTARRALKTSLNITNGYRIISKIPSSVYSYRYPKKVREALGYDGAKVFFLKAHLDGPNKAVLDAIDETKDKDGENRKLKWLTNKEALEQIECHDYMKSFNRGLFHEDSVDTGLILNRARHLAQMSSKN